MTDIAGIGPEIAKSLRGAGIETISGLSKQRSEDLMEIAGISKPLADRIIHEASKITEEEIDSERGAESEGKHIPQNQMNTSNWVYCRTCGQPVREEAEICPECGVRQDESDSGLDAKTWTVIGIISLIVGTFILTVVCAPIAIFAGYQVYRKNGWFTGSAISLAGLVELLLWGIWYLSYQQTFLG